MVFPERFSDLPDYAFPRLRSLLDAHPPGADPLNLSIGEPTHGVPAFVGEVIARTAGEFGRYPPNEGTPGLRAAFCDWVHRRYGVTLDPDTEVSSLNGTREGLFNAAIALCPETKAGARPAVLTPNPFYQVYAVAALSVAAEPVYVPATEATGHLPDFAALPAATLDRTAIAYVCSPANPQGAVASEAWWADLFRLAEKHDFRVFADECYSEIWEDAPPPGALTVARAGGVDPERVLAFHSLSKRSNAPGLRAGFVAGGPASIAAVKRLRAYSGAPIPLPLQHAAEALWRDEAHVEASRLRYVEKYRIARRVFDGLNDWDAPEAGFFLWLPVEDGEAAALKLWRETGIRVLPGAYLSRDTAAGNPGRGYVRVAMVADEEKMERGLIRIRECLRQ